MSASDDNCNGSKSVDGESSKCPTTKICNSLVVRIDQDSDDNLQALFDSVLNPGDSKRPLQVPFRMRKLPNSFFNPPANSKPTPTSVSHSRANSADSAYDGGSQPNVNHATIAKLHTEFPPNVTTNTLSQTHLPPTTKLTIFHSRAHSSPASLQQTYNIHTSNLNADADICLQDTKPPYTSNGAAGFNSSGGGECINRRNQIVPAQGSNNPIYHMKQRSYDVVSPIQLQNELGALPPGWEQAKTNDGQIYYLNHATKTTQWEDPRIQFKQQRTFQQAVNENVQRRNTGKEAITLADNLGPLPDGWEQAVTESGDVYFINHINRTTSWNDPRIPDFFQKSIKTHKLEVNWPSARQALKENEFLKPKQNVLARQNTNLQLDPFLSGDNHARQESGDSGLSLSSNTFSVNTDFMSPIDDSMDCMSESGSINSLTILDVPDTLVSSLQLEDNICDEMFNDVNCILNSSSKPDNLEWYKTN